MVTHMVARREDTELILAAMAYVEAVHRDVTAKNTVPQVEGRVVSAILADPQLSDYVRSWARKTAPFEASTDPPPRPPIDATYERVRELLRRAGKNHRAPSREQKKNRALDLAAFETVTHEVLPRVTLQIASGCRGVAAFHFLLLRRQRLCGSRLARETVGHEGLSRVTGKLLIAGLLVAQGHPLLLRVRRLGCRWISQ
jgi:hypothetical protein